MTSLLCRLSKSRALTFEESRVETACHTSIQNTIARTVVFICVGAIVSDLQFVFLTELGPTSLLQASDICNGLFLDIWDDLLQRVSQIVNAAQIFFHAKKILIRVAAYDVKLTLI